VPVVAEARCTESAVLSPAVSTPFPTAAESTSGLSDVPQPLLMKGQIARGKSPVSALPNEPVAYGTAKGVFSFCGAVKLSPSTTAAVTERKAFASRVLSWCSGSDAPPTAVDDGAAANSAGRG
jgi:hypothetical protein